LPKKVWPAVAKMTHLKEFRTWHSGATIDAVKRLLALPEIKSLIIGRRLASKPPTTVSDDTAVLAGFKSSGGNCRNGRKPT
jgi:hypothetical protein